MITLTSKNMMIFKNEKDGRISYSTTIANKKEDGSYDNASIQVQFRKGVEVENKSKINVTNGFLSFYRKQDNTPVFKFIVMDFETEGDAKEPETTSTFDNTDLPF